MSRTRTTTLYGICYVNLPSEYRLQAAQSGPLVLEPQSTFNGHRLPPCTYVQVISMPYRWHPSEYKLNTRVPVASYCVLSYISGAIPYPRILRRSAMCACRFHNMSIYAYVPRQRPTYFSDLQRYQPSHPPERRLGAHSDASCQPIITTVSNQSKYIHMYGTMKQRKAVVSWMCCECFSWYKCMWHGAIDEYLA